MPTSEMADYLYSAAYDEAETIYARALVLNEKVLDLSTKILLFLLIALQQSIGSRVDTPRQSHCMSGHMAGK